MDKVTVFASCDELYFYHHAIPFIRSCIDNGNACRVSVVDPSEQCREYMHALSKTSGVSCVESSTPVSKRIQSLSDEEKIPFYAGTRFYEAPGLLRELQSPVYITDVDCIIRKPLPALNEDIGVFLRHDEQLKMKTAAGIVYINNTVAGNAFADSVSRNLNELSLEWFADQTALWHAYNEIKSVASVYEFTQKEMHWGFSDDSALIWTGKGPRKDNSREYLAEKFYYALKGINI